MTVVDFLLVTGALWLIVGMVDFAQSRKRGPAVIQRLGGRIFSSFWPSVALHVGLFCAVYGAICYWVIQTSIMYELDSTNTLVNALVWGFGGVVGVAQLIEVMRIRTSDTWLLRRMMVRDLKEAEDPAAHLEKLLGIIQSRPEEESSKKALGILRELSTRGDSTAGLVWRALDKHGLAQSTST